MSVVYFKEILLLIVKQARKRLPLRHIFKLRLLSCGAHVRLRPQCILFGRGHRFPKRAAGCRSAVAACRWTRQEPYRFTILELIQTNQAFNFLICVSHRFSRIVPLIQCQHVDHGLIDSIIGQPLPAAAPFGQAVDPRHKQTPKDHVHKVGYASERHHYEAYALHLHDYARLLCLLTQFYRHCNFPDRTAKDQTIQKRRCECHTSIDVVHSDLVEGAPIQHI